MKRLTPLLAVTLFCLTGGVRGVQAQTTTETLAIIQKAESSHTEVIEEPTTGPTSIEPADEPSTAAQEALTFSTEIGTSVTLGELMAFLDSNPQATTQTLADGVQIREVQIGDGKLATTTTTRVIHFNMWLPNGKMIRSSRIEMYPLPVKFTPGQEQVIRGIEIGTEGMKVGGRRLLLVPPSVAYEDEGAHDVPPNSMLYYEVELLNAI